MCEASLSSYRSIHCSCGCNQRRTEGLCYRHSVTASAAETDTNERKYQGKDKLQCSSLENMRDYFEEWKMSSKRSPILLHGFMN